MSHLIFESILLAMGYAMLTLFAFFVLHLCGRCATNLGRTVQWRRCAQRVTGTLLNIVEVEGRFVSFYRYTLPSGAAFEAGSIVPAESCEERELFSQTKLLVFPDNPQLVCEEGGLIADGLAGAIPLFMLYTLLCQTMSAGRFTLFTWGMAGAAVAYTGFRFWKGLRAP